MSNESVHPIAQEIISILTAEIGYVETYSNITKYARELDAVEQPRIPRQGSAWCGTFMDWGFWKAGAIAALAGRAFSTPAGARSYMAKGWWHTTPQPGDLAFHSPGPKGHVGLVVLVNGDQITTLEGNTSSGNAGSQTNGGMVARRTRPASYWAGYGRPNYDAVATTDLTGLADLIAAARATTLALGSKGPAVSVLQNALHVLPVDGDFGPITEGAVKDFQAWYTGIRVAEGITDPFLLIPGYPAKQADGIVGPHTWAALLGEVPDR